MYIAVDGIDGTGKTTLCEALHKRIEARGQHAHRFTEPSNNPLGMLMREWLGHGLKGDIVWSKLFHADREIQMKPINEALNFGGAVVQDRTALSTLAYQGDKTGVDLFVNRLDLLIILDIPALEAAKRIIRRGIDDPGPLHVMESARMVYLDYLFDRKVVIDASKTPEEVLELAWPHVERLITKWDYF